MYIKLSFMYALLHFNTYLLEKHEAVTFFICYNLPCVFNATVEILKHIIWVNMKRNQMGILISCGNINKANITILV